MKKTILVLLGALAVLALILLKKNHDEKKIRTDFFVFDSTARSTVTEVRVMKGKDSSHVQKRDGVWKVVHGGFPVDTSKITKVFQGVFSLQANEVVSHNPERYSEYGLDSLEAKKVILTNVSGQNIANVFIGKTSGADYSSTYWRYDNKPDVYRSPGNFSWEIVPKDNDWKERKVTKAKQSDVKSVEVNWHDSTGALIHYKLSSTFSDTVWKMLEPQDSNRVKNNLAIEMARAFVDLSIDEFVDDSDTTLSHLKLDSPWVYIKVTLKNGTSMEIKAGKEMGAHPDSEHPGHKGMVSTMTYFQHPTEKEVVKVSSYKFNAYLKRPFELLNSRPAKEDTTIKNGAH